MRAGSRKGKPGTKGRALHAQAPQPDTQTAFNQTSFDWKDVFEAIPEGVSIHSSEGATLYANGRLAEICCKPLEEIVGRACAELFHFEPHACPHEEVMETGRRFELRSRQAVGERVYSISCEPIVNEAGSVNGYIRLMRDVTDKQRVQEELLNMERFATLGRMIFGVAHDVGTPLNIISGYCEYLLMRFKPEDPGHRELSTILHQTRRIADLIKQMLDLARPSQSRADAIGLKGFLTESFDLMGHQLRRRKVKASLVFDSDPPLIYSDATRLRQALFNILLNVSQQLGEGANMEVTIGESPTESRLIRISFAGIDRDGTGLDFSQSFAAFLDPAKSNEALGMGLSLARHILDEIGAKMETEDIQGKGKALSVYIPKDSRASAQQDV